MYSIRAGRVKKAPLLLLVAVAGCAAQHTALASSACALGVQSARFAMPDVARNFRSGWNVKVSIAGGKQRGVQIDTGSTGFVVGRKAIGAGATGPLAAGQQEYTSNGLILLGHYYRVRVKFEGPNSTAATAPMMILGVEKLACDPKYPKCSIRGRSAQSVGVLGVGFARKENIGANAFLQIDSMARGSMHAGYIISNNAVTLGLTAENTRGFQFIPLVRNGIDWRGAPGCFAFPGRPGFERICGTILVDTGIPSMIVSRAAALRPPGMKTNIPSGTAMSIAAPAFANAVMRYTFSVGDRGALTPSAIRWSKATGNSAFVNTGRNVIRAYDYLYDAKCGRVGFRARS
jgi:hypothetical protein